MATKKAIELDTAKLLGFKVAGTGILNSGAKVSGSKKTAAIGSKVGRPK